MDKRLVKQKSPLIQVKQQKIPPVKRFQPIMKKKK